MNLVLFDLDGTLLDDRNRAAEATAALLDSNLWFVGALDAVAPPR